MMILKHLLKLQKSTAHRIIWPYSEERDSIYRWRAYILSSILLAGLLFGTFALIAATPLIIRENVWGLAFVDFSGLILCLILLFAQRIRFEIRAFTTLLAFYFIGLSVIISVGPLSGGPAWLFAFAVLAGVLLGNRAAAIAILMNAVSLTTIGYLISAGLFGQDFPFFNTKQALISTGINYIVLNSITAVSVSTLLTILNTSEKRYRMIAKNVADVIWTMNMDLKFTYISPSVKQLLGFPTDEMMKKSIEQFIEPESIKKALGIFERKLRQLNEKNKQAWESEIFEAEHFCINGKTKWVNINARLIMGPDNLPEGILGISRDISERKRNEEEKIKNQKIIEENKRFALVGRIAGKMAHDFNNVLGIIMGQSELALLKYKEDHLKKIFKLIFDQTLRGRNLTKNLIAFAKTSEPKMEFFVVNDKIDVVLNLLKPDLEHINVITEDSGKIEILADPGMIEHALVNLIQNSIHALSRTDDPEIVISVFSSKNNNIIEIRDNGCGIPDKYIEQIFEPSFTLKGSQDRMDMYKHDIKGTGYGLANVKKYIELHHGKIRASSQVGVGTKFTIELNISEKTLTKSEKTIIQEQINITHKKILIVEDEAAISEVQKQILTQAPLYHEVDVAYNGKDALELLSNRKYDLISLDYTLPGSLNGMDVYRHIRKTDQIIPILFVSGNIEFLESIKKLHQEDPNVDNITKPCQNFEYIKRINRSFESIRKRINNGDL